MTAATADRLLTMKQVAERLAVGLQTAYRRVYDKELPWVNVGPAKGKRPSIRVRESVVAAYIDRRDRRMDAAPSSPGLVPQRSPAAKPG